MYISIVQDNYVGDLKLHENSMSQFDFYYAGYHKQWEIKMFPS